MFRPANAKLPALIPEFQSRFAILMRRDCCVWPTLSLSLTHAKLLCSFNLGEFDGNVELLGKLGAQTLPVSSAAHIFRCSALPIYAAPKIAFCVSELRKVNDNTQVGGGASCRKLTVKQRPMSAERVLPVQFIDAVSFNVNSSTAVVARCRADFVAKWTDRAVKLQEAESKSRVDVDRRLARSKVSVLNASVKC